MSIVGVVRSTRNYWWLTLIRSLVIILFGIAAVLRPGTTLLFFIYLFGAFAIVEGAIAIATAIEDRRVYKNWWALLLSGIAGIILGILVFSWPGITSLILFYIVAAWALMAGIMAIVSAFSRFTLPGLDWPLVVSGVVLIILGLIMADHPVRSILSIMWVLGIAAIIYGVLLFVRAFQFKSLQDRGAHTQGIRSSTGEYGYAERGAGSSSGEHGYAEPGTSSIFQTDDDYPVRRNTDNVPPERTPGAQESIPPTMPPGRNPTVQGTTPTTMPPGRNPNLEESPPTTMPPGRNPTVQGMTPTTMPPGRNPSTPGNIPTRGSASSRGTKPTRDNASARDNIPSRDDIPPESRRQSDTFAKDQSSWFEEEENS